MAMALTIPGIVECENVLSVTAVDGVTFEVTIAVDDTLVRLLHAAADGEMIPLVVLTTDAQIYALDSVYVSAVTDSSQPPVAHVTFAAQAVRLV
jgi:hypothetical protein